MKKVRGWRGINRDLPRWFAKIQRLIQKRSSRPRVAGKYKGHSSTDTAAWGRELVYAVYGNRPKGMDYDENMDYAASMGLLLVNWYVHLHTAKCLDPRRSPKDRKRAYKNVIEYRAVLVSSLADLRIMEKSFPQDFDLSWRKHER